MSADCGGDESDGLVVLAALAMPEIRQELTEAIRRTYLNPEFWHQLGRQMQQALLDPALWQQIAEELQRTLRNPEFWRRAALIATETNSERRLRQPVSTVNFLSKSGHEGFVAVDPILQEAATVSEQFDRQIEAVKDFGPPVIAGASIEWFLRSRNADLTLLFGAATTLLGLLLQLSEKSGIDVSEAVLILGAVMQVIGNLSQYRSSSGFPPG